MTPDRERDSAAAVIEEYVAATSEGSGSRLRMLFHPDALMSGYYQGEFSSGPPDPFYEEVKQVPADGSYAGRIVHAEQVGNMASVTLKETGYLGTDLTNWFHLARVGDRWQIMSKAYQDE